MTEFRGRTSRAAVLAGTAWAFYTWGRVAGYAHGHRIGLIQGTGQTLSAVMRDRAHEGSYYGGDPVIAADQLDPSGRRGWWAARHRESRA